jgi:molybdopterin molybdotransferase
MMFGQATCRPQVGRDQGVFFMPPTSTDRFATPDDALAALLFPLRTVVTEELPWQEAAGRVLARPITADRDSPPCDNSSMDGYAVRLADVRPEGVAVAGDAMIGRPPPTLPPGQALRIVTGAPLPAGADAVIRCEDVDQQSSMIVVRPGVELKVGQYIRRQGENVRQGESVVDAGRVIDTAVISAATTFGAARLCVYRRVRVGLLATGSELQRPESPVNSWQLRDSNGPALWAMLSGLPWLEPLPPRHVSDDPAAIRRALEQCLTDCDAVLLTGGVSMGQHDYVPDAIASTGAEILVRKLPIRPGHPLLGAVSHEGQPILGLPGNPVSVMVTARRFAAAVLQRLAGMIHAHSPASTVTVTNPDLAQSSLWWFRPVRLVSPGRVELLPSMGSGDIVAAANSDGFVEIPPQGHGAGPRLFWRWTIA